MNLYFGRHDPRVQIIWWGAWRGIRWHRWSPAYAKFFRGSLLLGWLELRVWR
jgi:hypothetical protein